MKKLAFTFTLLSFVACNKEIQKETSAPQPAATENKAKQQKTLKIENLSFPAEVQSCSCYFATSQEDFEKQKYIYIDDYGNNAYIKINGEIVKFPLEEGDFDPENFGKVIKNDRYTITIKGEKLQDQEEAMMFRGTMTVEDTAGNRTETPIYGECGC